MSQHQSQNPDPPKDPSPKPRKKNLRKIILIAAAALILLIVIAVSLIPTILNTDAARSMILDRINSSMLNGSLSIQSWSFSWTGGLQIQGLDLKDNSDAHVLSVGQLTSSLSLLDALTGKIALGNTELSAVDFNLRRDTHGNLNLSQLFKPSPTPSQSPSKLPEITGTLHFTGRTCTYEDDSAPTHVVATFDTIDGTIKITDINQPIETHLTVAAHVNNQPANLKVDGTISAIQNNLVDIPDLAATQTIALNTADSSADLQATVQAKLGGPLGILLPSLDITQGQFDLHKLQEQHFLDLLAANWLAQNSLRFNSGTITLAGKGKLDATGISLDQPIVLHIDPIDLTTADSTGSAQTAHLPQLDIHLTGAASQGFTAALTLGDAATPLLNVNLSGNTTGPVSLTKCDGDLPRLQAALAPVLPLFGSAANADALQQLATNVIAVTSGKFTATAAAAYDGKTLSFTQPLALNLQNLTIQQGGAPTSITALNLQTSIAGNFSPQEIQNLKCEISDPNVLTVDVAGNVDDLTGQRTVTGVTVNLDYDLAKLWPLIRPLLSQEQQQNFADLQIVGKQKRTITLAGSAQSLNSLEAFGYLSIDSLITHGTTVTNLDLPFWLKSGTLRTVHQDQPEGKNSPTIAQCNGGTLDIGALSADLTQSPIRLTMPGLDKQHPHQLLKNVALTPDMAKALFGSILNNPLFASSGSNQGYVDLSLLQLKDLPLSNLVTQSSSQNTGVAEVNYSIRQLATNGGLLGELGVTGDTPAEIDNADVLVQAGKVTQDTTVTFSQTQTLRIAGGVDLASLAFDNMNMDITKAFLGQHGIVNRDALAYLADPIQVPIEGNATSPKIDLGKVIQSAAQQSVFGALLGGQPSKQPASRPSQNQNQKQQQNQNPINGLLQGLMGQH